MCWFSHSTISVVYFLLGICGSGLPFIATCFCFSLHHVVVRSDDVVCVLDVGFLLHHSTSAAQCFSLLKAV